MATSHQPTTSSALHVPVLPIVAGTLISFGLIFLVMASAYVDDIEMIRSAPSAIWAFVCGIPSDDPIVLPLMLLIGMLTTLSGVGVALVAYLRRGL
ncbi:MAG: hypothetical protein HC893_03245 [Chloroflexaceae bacterium]|nr:hypothetical protein [Chloroflexaceae bacterium]NJL33036.1 hypothetical protein [Chloroflexaceae bacterium]NJO06847.1 hypothetical protein [Chloroflexaceae bacterium]